MSNGFNRRQFFAASTAACIAATAVTADDTAAKPWLRKSMKSNMFYGSASMEEHFAEGKEAGFEGIEMEVPVDRVDEAIAASKSSGLLIDGSFGSYHWQQRHTDSDRDVRFEAYKKLKEGLKQTGAMGGESMRIVPGHGNDGSEKKVLERVQEAIEAALPIAEENKVAILIENARNRMFYDQVGGKDQTADKLAEFIDRFDSPLVGVQFDIANAANFGDPAKWIKTLGTRIKKLDAKGYSRKDNNFTKIGGGDIDWPSVEAALHEINYTGWISVKFGRSNGPRLHEICQKLDQNLHCNQGFAHVD